MIWTTQNNGCQMENAAYAAEKIIAANPAGRAMTEKMTK